MSKKKITDPEGSMEELIARAVKAAQAPFIPDRKPELPSLRSVAVMPVSFSTSRIIVMAMAVSFITV